MRKHCLPALAAGFAIFAFLQVGCSYTVHPTGDGGAPSTGPTGSFGAGTGGGAGTHRAECSTDSSGCSCYAYSGSGNGTRCSAVSVPNALCCASSDWPSSGQCRCEHFGCGAGDYCSCYLGDSTGTATSCEAASGGICCLTSSNNCSCSTNQTSCYSGTQVSSCSLGTVRCAATELQVTSCSTSP